MSGGAGVRGGQLYGESDKHASSPRERPVHPTEILATVYHTLGIEPRMEVFNDLNQPRELVKADPILGLF